MIHPEASEETAVFGAHGLGCIRGDRAVFAGVELALNPGEARVLTGPNGSGKSSLLRMLAGLLEPASGGLRWRGEDVREAPEAHRGRLHYLGHHNAVKSALSVRENLMTWAALRGGGKDEVDAALAAFDLADLTDIPGRMLSSGQTRRLALARLRAAPAPLWLLDEPGVGLDAAALRRLAGVMAEHRAAGGMVVVATHQDLGLPDAPRLSMDAYPPAALSEMAVW